MGAGAGDGAEGSAGAWGCEDGGSTKLTVPGALSFVVTRGGTVVVAVCVEGSGEGDTVCVCVTTVGSRVVVGSPDPLRGPTVRAHARPPPTRSTSTAMSRPRPKPPLFSLSRSSGRCASCCATAVCCCCASSPCGGRFCGCAGLVVVGWATEASICVDSVAEGSWAMSVVVPPPGWLGRCPRRTWATASCSSLPSRKRVAASLRSAMPMSSRAGALIAVDKAGGSLDTWASATETELSPVKGRVPESIS